MRRSISRTSRVVWWGVLLLALVIAGVVIANRRYIVDWYRGINYTPTAEMAEIRDNLALTEGGRFLFNALQPALDEATEFNQNCHQNASETAVLGCYTGGAIHVYNITNPKLEGILEVTTAHEMLHAVWARMNGAEQESFLADLNEVLADNGEILDAEIGTYEQDLKLEEVYVRAGTEIADLPEKLEKHYANYFSDRQQIVNFYNNYIAVFNEIQDQVEDLQDEIAKQKEQLTTEINKYQQAAKDLEERVQEFNECAATQGCFSDRTVFASQRAKLVSDQQDLKAKNEQLNQAITEYNAKINEYNQLVDDSRKLEDEINSNSLKEIEF